MTDAKQRYQTYTARFGVYTVDMSGVPKDDRIEASEDLQGTLDLLFWRDPDLKVTSSDEVPESLDDRPHKIFEWDMDEKKWKRSESDPTYVPESTIDNLLESIDV
jgi:hypothetical protein